ncbi:MAG TPA: hypothetical protein PKA77_07390 [Chitinophagaceae bacterium]|jgi:hypothetical protein|nr:hypothetical protein [Chitinophagaceae bacterium]HMU58150.1 hypothetical protein [Chitinophagaceae bacterium]
MKKNNKFSGWFSFLPCLTFSVFISVSACKSDKDNKGNLHYISVKSIIEKQVAHIDTSLYSIVKITIHDSLHSDTSYIPREEFRNAAKDFLEIPDLSDTKIANRFKEENRYDSLIRKVIITYSPLNPKEEEIQKQELLVSPDVMVDSSNKVTNIIVDRVKKTRDGFWGQQMLWITDKSFLITTTTQKPGESEKIVTTRVIWNDEGIQ